VSLNDWDNCEDKGPAGSQDFEAPGTCSTSGLGTRPGMDVPQVATHMGVEDPVPGPPLEPVEFDFQSAGIPHSPAGLLVVGTQRGREIQYYNQKIIMQKQHQYSVGMCKFRKIPL
jgi:hypothetical protein